MVYSKSLTYYYIAILCVFSKKSLAFGKIKGLKNKHLNKRIAVFIYNNNINGNKIRGMLCFWTLICTNTI